MSTGSINEFKLRPLPHHRRPLSVTLPAAALAVVVAACLMLAPIAWTSDKLALQTHALTVIRCATIAPDAERLACYDLVGQDSLRPPAKGANAPLLSH